MREDALNIYTDGSSYQSPRRGGIGIRFITVDEHGAEVIDDREELGYKGATNNQMELLAAVLALRFALNRMTLPDLTALNYSRIRSMSLATIKRLCLAGRQIDGPIGMDVR